MLHNLYVHMSLIASESRDSGWCREEGTIRGTRGY